LGVFIYVLVLIGKYENNFKEHASYHKTVNDKAKEITWYRGNEVV
jgi:hypothetical protein